MIVQITIKGIDEILAGLKRFPDEVIKEFNTAIQQSIFNVERETKPITPVDTGRLRGSIGREGMEFRNLYGSIGTDVEYAIYVHEGTYKMKGRPFMEQGVEISMANIEKYFDDAAEKIIQKI